MAQKIAPALSSLLEAKRWYEAGHRIRKFGVSVLGLRRAYVRDEQIVWLFHQGCLREVVDAPPGAPRLLRAAPVCGPLDLNRSFMLTPKGFEMAVAVCDGPHVYMPSADQSLPPALQPASVLHPVWDAQRRELYLGRVLVKKFKQPSANQELVLTALEEDGWPQCGDNPFPDGPRGSAKRHLHNTIKALNRHQIHPVLHFRGDGSGDGILWEVTLELPQELP